ncbi:MAG: glycosyltransferase family 2 protein [Alphaproteobacteria bacterium]|nr:glycosyltransferase family 2 protein [Alphaproteobacteria bacterium]MDE1987587.1 glycosyltransferase family 2 protein [Alphaproteobacteria bacterium]MDE2164337.1 glycosyltransferase family 2 protein [Alphaproteobacteria bacterium]MDE2264700.1 glycosyltransferase family 2 protein [Alphaproteobacteria bacterium]MDE2501225.1 glycosyltransferase family 2 protein [Alphaproteobacteria bacterium]
MSLSVVEKQPDAAPERRVELSVVIPTFKERGNVAELIARLDRTLSGVDWEAVFVDDNSPDGTADAVKAIAGHDLRIRCLRRVGRRGLAGACIEGMLSSSATYLAVMDADLQHDETVLPEMLAKLRTGKFDLVAATRYVEGGSAQSFSESRSKISRTATRLTQRVLGTSLSDPMSGFFMMRRDAFDAMAERLSPVGFKILLDIATAKEGLRIAEQPYTFGERHEGESKFNVQIGLEFLGLLLAKLSNGLVEPRFIFFAVVGALGVAVNLAVLNVAMLVWPVSFMLAKSVATFFATTSNFLLNNSLTYRDRRLRGWGMLRGFIGFCVIGAIGAVTDVGLASQLYAEREVWWVAGLAGALMGVLWNYAMSSMFIWRTR